MTASQTARAPFSREIAPSTTPRPPIRVGFVSGTSRGFFDALAGDWIDFTLPQVEVPLVGGALGGKTYFVVQPRAGAAFTLWVHFHTGTWGPTMMSPLDIPIRFVVGWTPRGFYAQHKETR